MPKPKVCRQHQHTKEMKMKVAQILLKSRGLQWQRGEELIQEDGSNK
jgi:hypothetical protein